MVQTASKAAFGVGASLLRKEDARHLRGRGQFVADVKLADMRDVAFVRSPHAHARIKSIVIPPAPPDASSPRAICRGSRRCGRCRR
jgi:hypothetical protein